jgi:glycosyltransferase involved in cell wall biosynthesis/2-polyprenyl-3-methyl-5-hydroxy-6-metoxy-1,4-benzoquinol methylase
MPKVSIILTSFNHEKYLREAIDSALNQSFTDFELIIWDDASTDDSWKIIQSYSDTRIKIFRNDEQKRGIYGINKAISEFARCEYIAIHHSDDVWQSKKLEKQVAYLDSHYEVGAVFTNTLAIGEDGKPFIDGSHYYSKIFDQPNRSRHEWLRFFFEHGNALCHPSVLIRKECYNKCGLYRQGLAQVGDFHMWVRLCLKYEIHILSEPLTKFRIRDNEANASGSRPDARTRTITELFLTLRLYLDIVDSVELLAIFPEAEQFVRSDGCVIPFAIAMLSFYQSNQHYTKFFGLLLLYELMENQELFEKIRSLYGFNELDIIDIAGKFDSFNLLYVMRLKDEMAFKEKESDVSFAKNVARIAELEHKIFLQNELVSDLSPQIETSVNTITEIHPSISRKLTAPHRAIDSLLHASGEELMNSNRHNYEYQVDIRGATAPARVIRMVGSNKRVLEIGAGPGSITRILKNVNNCSVVALERDESAIKKLVPYCEKVIQADLNDPNWHQLLASEVAFDVLVCADVLEHVYNPVEVLSGIARFLDQETSLVVSLPHVGHSAIHACLFDSDFEYRDCGLLDRTHLRFFGLTNIAALFNDAGLKIVEAEFVTCEPEQTEFAPRWARLPESLKRELKANPYGLVYQVVVRAVPFASARVAVDLRGTPLTLTDSFALKRCGKQVKDFVRKHTTPEMRAQIRRLINSIRLIKI